MPGRRQASDSDSNRTYVTLSGFVAFITWVQLLIHRLALGGSGSTLRYVPAGSIGSFRKCRYCGIFGRWRRWVAEIVCLSYDWQELCLAFELAPSSVIIISLGIFLKVCAVCN